MARESASVPTANGWRPTATGFACGRSARGRKAHRIGGGVFAFCPNLKSPSGKLLAVADHGAVRLVNPDTGREYARLEDPDQDRANETSFNADGTQLIISNDDSRSIHVWDLRAIRERLDKMGLDWDLPPYPPAAADAGKPLRIEVDLGDLGAMIQAQDYWQRPCPWLCIPTPAAIPGLPLSWARKPFNWRRRTEIAGSLWG